MSRMRLMILPRLLLSYPLVPLLRFPLILMAKIHTRSPSPDFPGGQIAEHNKRRRRESTPTAPTTNISISGSATATPARMSTSTASSPSSPRRLNLSPEESLLRQVFVDLASQIDSSEPRPEPLVLRFTGGWVRDKLLGVPSADIDVGINNMTGFDFASRLTEFLKYNAAKYGIRARGVYKILSNPEKSKHLETATSKVNGLDIDFVNLRSEVYSGESRIPKEFGSPRGDALRRDCTINALFYNLHTQEVEDHTGQGLRDLEARLIRTPLPPKETFLDDPLRVLRLIRFSSRLGFEIVPEATEAMQLPEIKAALETKISRERVGIEVDKMLKGNNPYLSLKLIQISNLYTSIFTHTPPAPSDIPISRMMLAADVIKNYLSPDSAPSPSRYPFLLTLINDNPDKRMVWFNAALAPWESYPPIAIAKKHLPAPAAVVKEGLKVNNITTSIVTKSYSHVQAVHDAVNSFEGWDRGKVGIFLRNLGAEWMCAVACALVLEVIKKEGGVGEDEKILAKYEKFLQTVHNMGLSDVHNVKPTVDGKTLTEHLSRRSGPWMKDALDGIMEWQLNNPNSDTTTALAWVDENIDRLVPGHLSSPACPTPAIPAQ